MAQKREKSPLKKQLKPALIASLAPLPAPIASRAPRIALEADMRVETPSIPSDRAIKRKFPRLETLEHLVQCHVRELHQGDYVTRSRARWTQVTQQYAAPVESYAERAHRISRTSAALVIQSAWRRSAAVRLRERLVRGIWQHQMEIGAWIARDQTPLLELVELLGHPVSGSLLFSVQRVISQSIMGSTTSRGLYYQLSARLVSSWLCFTSIKQRANFLRRPPAILSAVDIPVRRTFRLITSVWRSITRCALLTLQCGVRSFLARCYFRRLLFQYRQTQAVVRLQCFYRVYRAHRFLTRLRIRRAATRIQCCWRCFMARKRVLSVRISKHSRIFVNEACAQGQRQAVNVILHRSARMIQKTYRGRRARGRFRVLLLQQEQAKWHQNPSKGLTLFEKKLYSQAATFLEHCFRQGIYQDALESTPSTAQQQEQMAPSYNERIPSGSVISFSFSAVPAKTFARSPTTYITASATAQLQFWQAYALSHFYAYEASGEVIHLSQARTGFETYLRADSRSTTTKQTHATERSFLRLHSRFRLVQCLLWSCGEDQGEASRALESCVELLDELQMHPGFLSMEMTTQMRTWHTELLIICSMLWFREGELEESVNQLDVALGYTNTLELRFVLALILLRLGAQEQKPAPYQFQEGDSKPIARAKCILKECYQEIELQRAVGYYHGILRADEANWILADGCIGAFLLHRESPTDNSAQPALCKVVLRVKLSDNPTRISCIRIEYQDGLYRTKKVPTGGHFSLHGLLRQLPATAALDFHNGIRRPIYVPSIEAKLLRDRSSYIEWKYQQREHLLNWEEWERRLRENGVYTSKHNETWGSLCLQMAKALEVQGVSVFSELVALEGIQHSRDRNLRAELWSIAGRSAINTHRRIEGTLRLQKAGIEAAVLRDAGLLDVNFKAIKRAMAHNAGVSRNESFTSHLERLGKLERMCVKAWGFDSFASSLSGAPFCEALLLDRVDLELFHECADTFFLRSMLRAHVRSFFTNGDFEEMHLDRALSCVMRIFGRSQATRRHGDDALPKLMTHLIGSDTYRHQVRPRRMDIVDINVLLLSWSRLPFQICFEMAEVLYRSAATPSNQLIDVYESLYGRLRGARPRNWAYGAYEELFLLRLAFLHAQMAQNRSIAYLKRAIQLMDELLALRKLRLLQRKGSVKRIQWPHMLRLPAKFSIEDLLFLRGFFWEMLEDARGTQSNVRRKSWRDYDALHQSLSTVVLTEQKRQYEAKASVESRSKRMTGLHVFIGDTLDLAISDILHSKPSVSIQCEGKTITTKEPPTWTNLAPSWSEYIDIDVHSTKARVLIYVKNRSRRRMDGDQTLGYVQVFMDDLLQSNHYEKPQYYDLICDDTSETRPRIRLGFQIMMRREQEVATRTSSNRSHGLWNLDDLQENLNGDLRVFVRTPWVWSSFGRLWSEDKDYFIAGWLYHRALSAWSDGSVLEDEYPAYADDLIELATSYRATMGLAWRAGGQPLLERALELLQLAYAASGATSMVLWKKVTHVSELLSESSASESLKHELAKAVPASSTWIKMYGTNENASDVYYFNQDTGMRFEGILSQRAVTEPLEYEGTEATVTRRAPQPRRVVVMKTEMRHRVQYYCEEQRRLHEADPFAWIAVFNPRRDEMQYFSQSSPETPSLRGSEVPSTYAMIADEFLMYHVLIVQEAYRKFRVVRQHQRLFRGVVQFVSWATKEWLAARLRLMIRAEEKRKWSLNCIHVVIQRATGLRAMDLLTSDPFVSLELVDATRTIVARGKTSVRKTTLNPRWHEEFQLEYAYSTHEKQYLLPQQLAVDTSESVAAPMLRLVVSDYDVITLPKTEIPVDALDKEGTSANARKAEKHDFLGLAIVPIAPLVDGKSLTADLKLRDEDGYDSPRPRGVLTISIEWMHLEEERFSEYRRNAITPNLLVMPRKKSRPKPSWDTLGALKDDWTVSQGAYHLVVSGCTEVATPLDQLLRLHRRWKQANAIGKTAEEAKLLEQRLEATMKKQYHTKFTALLHHAGQTHVTFDRLYQAMLPLAQDYAESFEYDISEAHELTLKAAVEAFSRATRATHQDQPIDPEVPENYPVALFVQVAERILKLRVAIFSWNKAYSGIAAFFEDAPSWELSPTDTQLIQQLDKLTVMLPESDEVTSDQEQRRPTTPPAMALKPVATISTIPTQETPTGKSAVAKRLERLEKERKKQERGKGTRG